MSDRFFSAEPIMGEQVLIEGPEAHHLLHVMRATVGERVTLFDDSGAEFAAEVTSCGRAHVELAILDRRAIDRELPFELTLGVSLPKGDRQKWLVEKLTELGVTELVPLVTERGVAQPTASAITRLERTVIEAAKQCGRNRLMRIAEPLSWDEWKGASADDSPAEIAGDPRSPESHQWICHPGGQPTSHLNLSTAAPTRIAIGPEGGFTDLEIATAVNAGWQTIDLGPRLLRVETAAVAIAATVVALSVQP
jgi:16S rRNA (uracil1498-N3)-methyltransferase